MKTRNFIKNSIYTLLPISLGISVLMGIGSNSISGVEAYSGTSLPTTIDLNDPNESTIRSYYSNLNALSVSEKKGNNLLKNLKPILSNGQKYYNYDSGDLVWKMYEITDRDWDKSPASGTTYGTYNSSTNTITNYVYGSNSDSKNNPYLHAFYMDRDQTNVVRAWGNHNQDATGINREHLWAKAEGFDGSGAAGARGDPMHLVAANGYANNIHSNNFYGYVDKSKSYVDVKDKYSTLGHNLSGKSLTFPQSSVQVFEPQDSDKGDIARAIFYMAARYNNFAGKTASQETFDSDNPNLMLTNDLSTWRASGYTSTASSPGYHGIVSDLLEWNRIDPPDDYEIHRNNLLYTNFTNNRNPFIDFPTWADLIWGDSTSSADPISDVLNGRGTAKTVKSISITSQPSKSVYTEGESFSTSGMVVTAKYSDNSTKIITDYTYSPMGALTLGTDQIVVSYDGKTANVPINVIQQGTQLIRYFEKVNSNLTSGNYLIVSDLEGAAWKTGESGSANAVSISYDDDEHIIYTAELGIALFSFDLENGSIYAPNNKYIYQNENKPGVKRSDTPIQNTITLNDGVLSIVGSSGAKLWCNRNGGNPTFNFYGSASTYSAINIYRLVERVQDIHPESITVSPSTATLEIDGSRTLTASVLPLDTTDKSVTWSSSNSSIVSVDQNGRIVAKSSGQATITARSNDPSSSVYGTCVVTVPEPVSLTRIEISGTFKTNYYVGEEFNADGITVNAIYNQGEVEAYRENVTDDTEFTGFDSQSEGIKKITATYNGSTDSFNINVQAVHTEENTVKVISSTYGFENKTVVSELEKDNYKVIFDKGSGSVNPCYYTTGSAVRAYSGNTIKITGPYKIVKISFVFDNGGNSNVITPDKGSYNDSTRVWSSASAVDDVTFTIGGTTGHRRIAEIHIEYDPNSASTKELLSISLSGNQQKTFDVGDTFNYTGLIVTAHYNDGSSSEVTPASVTGADMSKAGEQEITVSYIENEVTKTATYSIMVNETIVLTEITLSGTHKTSFFVGDAFDRTGLVVTAHYSDEKTKVVTPTAVTGYNMNVPSSMQTVTVYYSENDIEVSDTYSIEVVDIIPDSLEVTSIEKTEYIQGDSFNDNITVTVTYNNGNTKVVTPTNIDGYDMSTAGQQTVNVEYTEKDVTVSDSYTINVGKLTPKSLSFSGNYQTEFYAGSTFNHDGLEVTALLNNNQEIDVTDNVEFTSPDMSTAGTETITVSYTLNDVTKSNTYDITVIAVIPTKIELSGNPKNSFFVGDTFDSTGLVVTATFNNGNIEGVTSSSSVTAPDMSTDGEKSVNVSYTYGGTTVNASYKVTVIKVVPETLTITGTYKTTFSVGDTFTHEGLGAHVVLNNGNEKDVTPVVTAPDMSKKGTKTVTVSYTENGTTVSDTYEITVNAIVRSISLDKTNLSVDLHDLVKKNLTATINADVGAEYTLNWSVKDNTILSITQNGNSVQINPLKVGSTTIEVSAGGKTATCNVTVTSLVSGITITGDQTVEAGKSINLSAAVLPNDATEGIVNWSTSNAGILSINANGNNVTVNAVGSTGQSATITASAKDGSGVSDSITITIISIESIRIEYSGINNDNKVSFAQYKSNENVNASVKAVWSNGKVEDVTDSATKSFRINCLVLGEQQISASYKNFEASLTLKVTNEGSSQYVGWNSKVTRADVTYNATPLQQAEAWADYFVKLTGGGEFDGPCKLPESERKAALDKIWSEVNSEYGFMNSLSKDEFCNTSTTSVKIADAMKHYKYICSTYKMTQFVEDSGHNKPVINNSPIWMREVVSYSLIGVSIFVAIGVALIIIFVSYKKHKRNRA